MNRNQKDETQPEVRRRFSGKRRCPLPTSASASPHLLQILCYFPSFFVDDTKKDSDDDDDDHPQNFRTPKMLLKIFINKFYLEKGLSAFFEFQRMWATRLSKKLKM